MTDDPVAFEVLGDLRAIRADTELELGPAKQRAVLAVLLLNAGRPVAVAQIVDAVWGEEPPENGANVVQKYMAGLRRILDPSHAPRTPGELLPLSSGGYTLRIEPDAVDALRFEAGLVQASALRKSGQFTEAAALLREVLALWRGEALAGLSGAVFEAARLRLSEARATAWEKWAEIELARGNHTGVMPDLVRLVEQFPLREGLRSHLMVALHQGGRQAEALAVFRDAREYFLDEFGVEPGEMLQETHRRILRGERLYTEPVDPWASSSEPESPSAAGEAAYVPPISPPPFAGAAAYVPPYVPPDPTVQTPPPHWGNTTPLPLRVSKGFPVGQVIVASLLPILLCSIGSWIYFVYAGIYRRDRRQFVAAAVYLVLFIVACVIMGIDPSPVNSKDTTPLENVAICMWLTIAVVAAVHGGVLASHPGDSPLARTLRAQARMFAAYNPAQALHMGVGRPDLSRSYDDGGLIDINHAPSHVLTQLPGITPQTAQAITIGRFARPYLQPEEMIVRGFVTSKMLHRMASWVICLPPQTAPAWHDASPPPRY
ncbi:BTAD domain-containing putative transcriptional regulator [Actinoplanes sp. TFC3]|uniref:BTAD domain-containing putative transcriptional regulator n=1 Tax=Actinoplanes sp. TFC3 TaxID=1710355 RepID=UPI00137A5086|nr:BTAD domain-containing putative transcriptional regulator [Actinoplanes sp. TFC3]